MTVARPVEVETEVARSRFRCRVQRVGEEEQARAVVESARRTHRDAGHHCSAMLLGTPPGVLERSSDDGEPAGTAGAPMLEVLRGAGVPEEPFSDVVAVVTRWFGGTLLGAGGLVRAYGDAVRAALAEAGTRRVVLLHEVEVVVDHALAGRLESGLRTAAGGGALPGVVVLGHEYAGAVTLRVGVPPEGRAALEAVTAELTGGAAQVVDAGERWVDRE